MQRPSLLNQWGWGPMAAVAAVVLVGCALLFGILQQQAVQHLRAEVRLHDLAALAHRMSGLEERAIAYGVTDPLRRELDSVRSQCGALLDGLDAGGGLAIDRIRVAYFEYGRDLDVELRLVEEGRVKKARAWDTSRVDPGHGRLIATVEDARNTIELSSARAWRLAQLGSLLTMLVAACLIGFVGWRAQGMRNRVATAVLEQEALREGAARLEQANIQLQEASRLKSEFLANMSHELRTPLTGLLGFLHLIDDDLCETKEEERDFLRRSLRSGNKLLDLINDLLDLARIESGKASLDIRGVPLGGLFRELSEEFAAQTRRKDLTLDLENPRGLEVRADAKKLRQVLVNLIGNAVKFTPSGRVTVRAAERTGSGHVLIEVIDTGIGIPLDRQGIVFNAFTQVDGSVTRQYGGTGIGLALCKTYVEMMGGLIGVESAGVGHGTRLFFTLPLWQGEALAGDAEPSIAPGHDAATGPGSFSAPAAAMGATTDAGPPVLVVEDDLQVQGVIRILLTKAGCQVHEAVSAEQGWVLMRRVNPELVILDYALESAPDATLRTGCDLALKIEESIGPVQLIFLTGHPEELRDRLRDLGLVSPFEILGKPFRIEAFQSLIERVGPRPATPERNREAA